MEGQKRLQALVLALKEKYKETENTLKKAEEKITCLGGGSTKRKKQIRRCWCLTLMVKCGLQGIFSSQHVFPAGTEGQGSFCPS